MAGAIAARAGVKISPDLDTFRKELTTGLKRAVRGLKVEIPVDVDPANLRNRLENAMRRAVIGVKVQVPVEFIPGIAELRSKLETLVKAAARGVDVEIPVKWDKKGLAGLGKSLGGGGGGDPGERLRSIATNAIRASLALGSLGNALPAIAGVVTSIADLSGAALLLPGALLAGAAAFATIKVATAGFADALKGDEEALAKLAPSARETVNALKGLEGQWNEVRSAVQDNFFAGFGQTVKDLAGTYLPVLKLGLGGVAGQFNEMAKYSAKALLEPQQVSAVDNIFLQLATTLGNARTSLGDFIAGFVQLGSIGSEYLPQLGTVISGLAESFRTWVADNPEKIRAMIDAALAAFNDLWVIITNLGAIVGDLWAGLSGGSGATSFLQTFRDLTTTVLQFLQTVEAQTALQTLGEALATAGAAVNDIFLAALQAAGPIITALAPIFAEIARQVSELLVPALQTVGDIFTTIGPTLQDNAGLIAGFVLALGGIGLAVKGVLLAFQTYQAFMKTWQTLTKVWTGVQAAFNFVMGLNPITIVVIAIIAFIAAIVLAYQNSETFRNIVDGAFQAVVAAGQWLIDQIVAAFNWFVELPGLALQWMSDFLASIVSGGQAVIDWFTSLPQTILDALGNVGTFLLDSGKALIQGFWDGLVSVWNNVVRWVQDSMAWLRGFWPFSPAKRGAFSGSGYLTYSGKAMMKDWGKAIQSGGKTVGGIASGVMANVQGIFGEPLDANIGREVEKAARSLPSGMSAEVRGVVGSEDFGINQDGLAEAIVDGLTGSTLKVDGNGVAKLVNKTNVRKDRRGK